MNEMAGVSAYLNIHQRVFFAEHAILAEWEPKRMNDKYGGKLANKITQKQKQEEIHSLPI